MSSSSKLLSVSVVCQLGKVDEDNKEFSPLTNAEMKIEDDETVVSATSNPRDSPVSPLPSLEACYCRPVLVHNHLASYEINIHKNCDFCCDTPLKQVGTNGSQAQEWGRDDLRYKLSKVIDYKITALLAQDPFNSLVNYPC